jgi:hypothetical protein
LAAEGMAAADGAHAGTSPSWIEVVRRKIASGEMDPTDAVAEAIWHHRQRRASQRYGR